MFLVVVAIVAVFSRISCSTFSYRSSGVCCCLHDSNTVNTYMLNIMHICMYACIIVKRKFVCVSRARESYVYAAATQRGKLNVNRLARTQANTLTCI